MGTKDEKQAEEKSNSVKDAEEKEKFCSYLGGIDVDADLEELRMRDCFQSC